MSTTDWIALLGIALPLVGNLFVHTAAMLDARKHAGLARIVGMAGREAATAARVLANFGPTGDPKKMERELIESATTKVMGRFGPEVALTDGDAAKVAGIVQGELDKWMVAPVAAKPAA